MAFKITMILPQQRHQGALASRSKEIDLTDFIDDDPEFPLCLSEISSVLAEQGVQVEIDGFFREALRFSDGEDIVFVLENLPRLFDFLGNRASTQFSLGLWGQGVETVFTFKKVENDFLRVEYSSRIIRAVERKDETIARSDFAEQLLAFVNTYRQALQEYIPRLLDEPWNLKVFEKSNVLANQ